MKKIILANRNCFGRVHHRIHDELSRQTKHGCGRNKHNCKFRLFFLKGKSNTRSSQGQRTLDQIQLQRGQIKTAWEILDSFGEIKGQVGNLGNASGEFVRPTGLAVWNDRLYVIDSGNSRVQILDENFHTIRSIELDQLSDSQNNYYMDISIF